MKAGMTAAAASILDTQQAFAARLAELPAARGEQGSFPELRDAYALAPDLTYFNHASIGTIPKIVRQAQHEYQQLCETNPWLYIWDDGWPNGREVIRGKAAVALGCAAEEMALTHNTTEAFNMLALGLPLGPGDEVVFSSLNHAGASVCWSYQAEARGFSVKRFDFPVARAAELGEDDLVAAYEREISPATKVLVFPHIDNIVGFRYPVKKMAGMARAKGVQFVAVDGAQAAGMIDFAVSDLGVDFYATSPHKWLQGPKESGLLYVNEGVLDQVRPMWVTWGHARWRGTVRVFEDYGTRNMPELMALGHAIDFQNELGARAKEERYRHLWQHFLTAVDRRPGVIWRSPRSWGFGSGLFAIELEGHRSSEVFEKLIREHGYVFRPFATQGLNTMRISPNVFNTEDEIDRFLDVLQSL
jgi:selenocysteine lyase/cysteine desulfurase